MTQCNAIPLALLFLWTWTAWAGETKRVFVLEKRGEGLLCAYTDEPAWREAAVDTEKPQYVAIVKTRGRRVEQVLVVRYTEDSQTFDEYTVEGGRRVGELRRSIAHVTNRVRREQVWRIEHGRARLVSDTWREWEGDGVVPGEESLRDFAGARVVTRTGEFPFWRLTSGGARCVAGTMAGLETNVR